jgi:hypothetical protein
MGFALREEEKTGDDDEQHPRLASPRSTQSLCIKTVARSRFYIITAIIYLIVKDGAYFTASHIFISLCAAACTWLMNINFSPDEERGFGRAQNLNSPPGDAAA